MKSDFIPRMAHILLLLCWVLLLGLFFAKTEIQIEGAHGWAASLPTWRIEKHLLLDMFWGGRYGKIVDEVGGSAMTLQSLTALVTGAGRVA